MLKKSAPFELMGPNVSKAIGMKVWVRANDWYCSPFRSAAPSAAAPAVDDGASRYDSARVSVTVTYQVLHLPACHEICVNPSAWTLAV